MADRWGYRIERVFSAVETVKAVGIDGISRNFIRQVSILSLVLSGVVCPLQFHAAAMDFSLAAVHAAQGGGSEGDDSGEDIGGYPEGEGGAKSAGMTEDESWDGEDGRFSRTAVDRRQAADAHQIPGDHLDDLNGLVPVSPEQEADLLGKWGDE